MRTFALLLPLAWVACSGRGEVHSDAVQGTGGAVAEGAPGSTGSAGSSGAGSSGGGSSGAGSSGAGSSGGGSSGAGDFSVAGGSRNGAAAGADASGRGGMTHASGSSDAAPWAEPSNSCHNAKCTGSNDCCDGYLCAILSSSTSICRESCSQDADCYTGCCASLGSSFKACLEPNYCNRVFCAAPGQTCFDTVSCCAGSACIQSSSDSVGTCLSRCSADFDCPTNCCYGVPRSETRICMSPNYCDP